MRLKSPKSRSKQRRVRFDGEKSGNHGSSRRCCRRCCRRHRRRRRRFSTAPPAHEQNQTTLTPSRGKNMTHHFFVSENLLRN